MHVNSVRIEMTIRVFYFTVPALYWNVSDENIGFTVLAVNKYTRCVLCWYMYGEDDYFIVNYNCTMETLNLPCIQ